VLLRFKARTQRVNLLIVIYFLFSDNALQDICLRFFFIYSRSSADVIGSGTVC
jgi:hypothetical protein